MERMRRRLSMVASNGLSTEEPFYDGRVPRP